LADVIAGHISVNLSAGNLFCGSLRKGTTTLGAMYGAYGIGRMLPLIDHYVAVARAYAGAGRVLSTGLLQAHTDRTDQRGAQRRRTNIAKRVNIFLAFPSLYFFLLQL